MKLSNLTDVLHHELKDLYSAEKQIVKALPKMAKAASSKELRSAFEEHLKQTQQHVSRLEQIGETLGVKLTGHTCEGMAGLIKEGDGLLQENDPSDALDAALIAAAQRIEHYEMAAYGSARTYAHQLGKDDVKKTLQLTLNEEADADQKLTEIAEDRVNRGAVSA